MHCGNSDTLLHELTDYLTADRRVCPLPPHWDELWRMLRHPERAEQLQPPPPPPLILASWHVTSDRDKRSRLLEQIRYAGDKGYLHIIADYLFSLQPDEWSYEDK